MQSSANCAQRQRQIIVASHSERARLLTAVCAAGSCYYCCEVIMAKVKHGQLVDFISGRMSNSVLSPAPNKLFSYSRNYVYPKLTDHNHDMGKIMRNLAVLYAGTDVDYQADGTEYARRFYIENNSNPGLKAPVNNSFGQFIKAAFAWYDTDPEHIDLSEVTAEDIVSADADLRTWARMVEAGYISPVSGWTEFTHGIL